MKYKVEVTETRTYSQIIEVDAVEEDEANAFAREEFEFDSYRSTVSLDSQIVSGPAPYVICYFEKTICGVGLTDDAAKKDALREHWRRIYDEKKDGHKALACLEACSYAPCTERLFVEVVERNENPKWLIRPDGVADLAEAHDKRN